MTARSAAILLPDVEPLQRWVDRISHGLSAAAFDEGLAPFVLLPRFASRKSSSRRKGASWVCYVEWNHGTVALPNTPLRWRYSGDGASSWHECTVAIDGSVAGDWPNGACAPEISFRSPKWLVQHGESATIELLYALIEFVTFRVAEAGRYKAFEIDESMPLSLYRGSSMRTVVDGATVDALTTTILFGDPSSGLSAVAKALIMGVASGRYDNVPITFCLERNLGAAAISAVNRAIGEAGTVGPRIRRAARILGTTDPEAISEHLAATGVKERIGRVRIAKALSVDALPDARIVDGGEAWLAPDRISREPAEGFSESAWTHGGAYASAFSGGLD